jgi:hypothetical protein
MKDRKGEEHETMEHGKKLEYLTSEFKETLSGL